MPIDTDVGGVVDSVELQPRGQRRSGQLPARVIHLQHGRGRNAQIRRQHQAAARLRRRLQAGGQRRAESVAAVVVLETLYFQVHRRHERGHGAAGEGEASLIDRHVNCAERHLVAAALQIGDALGTRTAEHLGQRQIVKVHRMQELRAVRARPVGIAGGKQHGIGIERRSQQHRLGFGAAAFVVVQFGQRVEVWPVHASSDGLGAQRGDGVVWPIVEQLEQSGAAQNGARCLTQLVAGQRGAIEVVVGGAEVHTVDLHRCAARGEDEAN